MARVTRNSQLATRNSQLVWLRLFAPASSLALLLLLTAWLRVTHHNWDQGQHFVPDEYLMTNTALDRVELPPDTTLAELLDPQLSPINPRLQGRLYHYGALPVYVTKVAAVAAF